ncbi:hypothetical protein [Rhizobium sp. BR 362]|uniref:hypothetical protein n=1 Tax=Rhizobium sp. BR 362 TaxID=3040670 RepID=UPI002F3F5D20
MFVQRNNDGAISGVFIEICPGVAEEALPDDDPAVVAFLNPAPRPVEIVSARQFKLQLLAAGLLDQVDAWVKTQDRSVQIAYEYSGAFVKDSPMMQQGFAAMQFTSQQIDDFFNEAAKL